MNDVALVRRIATFLVVAASTALLSSCATPPPQPRLETIRDLALLSVLGEEPGTRVTSVDGVALGGGRRVGRYPGDAPPGMHGETGIWLSRGHHLVDVQYVRNIQGGIGFTRGNVSVHLLPGHTYIVRPRVSSDLATVSFSVVDHGASFPIGCLPWSIRTSTPREAGGAQAKVTRAEILACRARMAS